MSLKDILAQEGAREQQRLAAGLAAANRAIKAKLESPSTREERLARFAVAEKEIARLAERSGIRGIFHEAARLTKGKITKDDLDSPWAEKVVAPTEEWSREWLTGNWEKALCKEIKLEWLIEKGGDPIREVRSGLLDFILYFNHNIEDVNIGAKVFMDGILICATGEEMIPISQAYDQQVLELAVFRAIRNPKHHYEREPEWR